MSCSCNSSYSNKQTCSSSCSNTYHNSGAYPNNHNVGTCERNCTPCNKYCTPCYPIHSPLTLYYSEKFHSLEHNYPVNKCLCHNFGINPRYYNPPHIPCNCKQKCYPC